MQPLSERINLSRRQFIAASAAFASLHSLNSFGQQLDKGIDPAAPRGRQRDLLVKSCTPEKLAASLIPYASYRPFPTIAEPDGVVSEKAPVLSSIERFGLVASCTDQTQKQRKLQKYISPPVSFRTKEGSGTANLS